MDKNFSIEGKHTTHSGGKGEYLHDWYSYLEGFSSSFVSGILDSYAPHAKIVLEPFAGVGTTPVYCSLHGLKTYYCEINPVLRKIISAKNTVISLNETEKENFLKRLESLISSLISNVEESKPSETLLVNYHNVFGKSVFFEKDTLNKVLKFRTYIDDLIETDSLLAISVEVAVLSCLVKCSLLKRSGDVRFKTPKELAKGIPDLYESVIKQLELMAKDCVICPQSIAEMSLLGNNAKETLGLDSVNADIVITSPPYLNGTNYFRNTKLELWFINELFDKSSLRSFRDQVVTSGINDVTKTKGIDTLPITEDLYKELSENSYDSRIPMMMTAYFYEMQLVFKGLQHHTKSDGIICIDIGDSVYAGVHIPTHKILTQIGCDLGWYLVEEVLLRSRRSKGGRELGQYLLVFSNGINEDT